MKIISTNIAKPRTFYHNGNEVTTGIYKKPIDHSIYLGKDNVKGDEVSDRRVHGGEFKACYLFSATHYPYWKSRYPELGWTYGMLGENLTVENLDEKKLIVGDIYNVGEAQIQITIPREPCFKFAHKFGTDAVLQQFVEHGCPGTYVRILNEGNVKNNDNFKLVERSKHSISIHELFQLLYAKNKNESHIKLMIEHDAVPEKLKKRLNYFLK
ncbi:MOSC domain-containing protein [Winogradskyella ursingii]|uniref:MOSC domain-containing protein n=1 Tax=Winogradskyella ursingii TaxID=2686079 RepID=UPI0015C820F0|nr:MOSC domain-containing protein [Winogradskyella ursingii]